MYLHTAIGHLLFVLCRGEFSNPAVSSISSNRDDPPVNKYRVFHNYSIDKSQYDNIRPLLNLEYTTPLLRSIQYAPLIIRRKEKSDVYSQAFVKNLNKTHSMEIKEDTKNHTRQLEPQGHNDKITESTTSPPVPIIYGYNIDFPALNKVKYVKKNLLKKDNYNHVTKLKKSPVLKLNIDMKESLRSKTLRNMNEKNVLRDGKSIKTVQVLLAMENAQIQPALEYGKMPYLHLNVARSFNVARTPHKAQKNEYVLKNRQRVLLGRSSLFYSMPNIKYKFAQKLQNKFYFPK